MQQDAGCRGEGLAKFDKTRLGVGWPRTSGATFPSKT